MTYLSFHLWFTLPPLVALAVLRARPADVPWRRAVAVGAGLSGLALVYTLPWDAYLVARGVWTYGSGRVLATVAGVPVEEVLFFVLQTALVTLWTLALMRWAGTPRAPRRVRAAQVIGAAAGLALAAGGVALALHPRTLYLGLILAWAGPPLAIQWGWGLDLLMRQWRVWLGGIATPALYLATVDAIAIRDGVWTIAAGTSTGWTVGGLPFEEALFFVVTSALVVQGVLLGLDLLARQDGPAGGRTVPAGRVGAGAPVAEAAAAPAAAWFSGPAAPAAVRGAVGQRVLWPSRFALAALIPFGPLSASWPPAVLVAPLVASLVVFGLPHGAVDPFVLSRTPAGRIAVSAGYLAVVGAALAVWAWVPVASALAFLVLTWVHWGLGDLHTMIAFDGAIHLRTRAQRMATVVVRGGLPMLVPLVASPDVYRRVVGWMAGALGTGGAGLGAAEVLFRPDVRLALGAFFGVFAVGTLAVGRRRAGPTGRRAWRLDAAETAGLAAFFALVEPLLAVGLYFCLWHAPRHIARLVSWSPAAVDRIARGDGRGAGAGFALRAAPGTVGALALVGLLWALVGQHATLGAAVGLYLAVVASLTVPHAAVVSWMDRAEGLWR